MLQIENAEKRGEAVVIGEAVVMVGEKRGEAVVMVTEEEGAFNLLLHILPILS